MLCSLKGVKLSVDSGVMIEEVCSLGYVLVLCEGDSGTFCHVEHCLRVIRLEAWCMSPTLGALAVTAHECAHVLQQGGLVFSLYEMIPCSLTRWIVEFDAGRIATKLLKRHYNSVLNREHWQLVSKYYHMVHSAYFRA